MYISQIHNAGQTLCYKKSPAWHLRDQLVEVVECDGNDTCMFCRSNGNICLIVVVVKTLTKRGLLLLLRHWVEGRDFLILN